MREAKVKTAGGKFRQTIEIRSHTLIADQPLAIEGEDQGPDPHEFLLAALGACTSMTVKLYADRKGWPLERVQVIVTFEESGGTAKYHRAITLEGPLDDDQRKRLLDIAGKCPVHKTLTSKVEIESALV